MEGTNRQFGFTARERRVTYKDRMEALGLGKAQVSVPYTNIRINPCTRQYNAKRDEPNHI